MTENTFYLLCKKMIKLTLKTIQPKLKELGLFPGQDLFLGFIANNEGITAIELAKLTNRKRSTITKSLQSLEQRNYIYKVANDKDKRKHHLYLTEKGKNATYEIQKIANTIIKKYEKLITEEEQKVIETVFMKISKELKEEDIW